MLNAVLECVVNISEGRDDATIAALGEAAEPDLLDVHRDPHHHRAVFTLVGEAAPRRLAEAALGRLDVRRHEGVHPRLGVVDVVPFVALERTAPADAVAARDRFAVWLARAHKVPCFLYGRGVERTLPEVRRRAFRDLGPDVGPRKAHRRFGATCVGARPALVAYNVWLRGAELAQARWLASVVRMPQVRALGLQVGDRIQVSMNLVQPTVVGPADAYDRVRSLAHTVGVAVAGAELVGLVPQRVLDAVPRPRWDELDLAEDRTIEARMARSRPAQAR